MPLTNDSVIVSAARDGQVRCHVTSTTGELVDSKRVAHHNDSAHKVISVTFLSFFFVIPSSFSCLTISLLLSGTCTCTCNLCYFLFFLSFFIVTPSSFSSFSFLTIFLLLHTICQLALEPDNPHVFLSCGEDGNVLQIDLRENGSQRNKLVIQFETKYVWREKYLY